MWRCSHLSSSQAILSLSEWLHWHLVGTSRTPESPGRAGEGAAWGKTGALLGSLPSRRRGLGLGTLPCSSPGLWCRPGDGQIPNPPQSHPNPPFSPGTQVLLDRWSLCGRKPRLDFSGWKRVVTCRWQICFFGFLGQRENSEKAISLSDGMSEGAYSISAYF